MKKTHLAKYGQKVMASLAIILMLCSYFPAIISVVRAVNETANELTKQEQEQLNEQEETQPQAKAQTQAVAQPQAEIIDQEVVIKDQKLKNYLLEYYDKDQNQKLTQSEMQEITSLYLNIPTSDASEVIDLSGIEYATNIEYLELDNTIYSNMESIYNLPKLKNLTLKTRNIEYLSKFSRAKNLESLTLNNYYNDNSVTIDYNYVNSLTNLKGLGISDYSLEEFNIDLIAGLTNLESLSIENGDKHTNIQNIGKLTKLKDLNIQDYIEDLTPLSGLTNLKSLNIKTTSTTNNINTIMGLKLEHLDYSEEIRDVLIYKDKKEEVELPTAITKMREAIGNSYEENISVVSSVMSLNEAKDKVIYDASNAQLGSQDGDNIYASYYKYDEATQTNINFYVHVTIYYTVRQAVNEKVEVNILDQNLKNKLLQENDVDGDQKITNYDMLQLIELNIYYNSDITDLTGLEYATNIEHLHISDVEYQNASAIYNLPNLKSLYVKNNAISKLSNFKSINKLEELHLERYGENTNPVDYSYIASLTNLKTLEIRDNNQTTQFSLSTLSTLTNLESLNIDNNLNTLEGIDNFTKLTYLYVDNYIEDIAPLNKLKNLKNLKINTVDSDANMNVIKALNLQDLMYEQDLETIYIDKGKKIEIDIPSVIRKMKDPSSPLKVEEVRIDGDIAELTDTKLIIDATNKEIGDMGSINIRGYYHRYDENTQTNYNTNVYVHYNYKVHHAVDKKVEANIPDNDLKRYLLKNYDVDKDGTLTNYDMLQITYFSIPNYNDYAVKNLTGLELAQNISSLGIEKEYEDLSPINQLKNVKSLGLGYGAVSTMKKLTIMNNIENLGISYYSYEPELDYAYIGTLKNLKSLNIYDNGRKSNIDLNNLKGLTNLQSLSFNVNTKFDNITALQSLTALRSLGLHTGDILDDIEFLSKMTELTSLDLSDNMISYINPLRNLNKLTYLNLTMNPINTKESETAKTLQMLRDRNVDINVPETNSSPNIEFKDARFKQMLIKNNGADYNKDKQISQEEMERLTYIGISASDSEPLSSIEELSYAKNVSTVNIYSKIGDLTPIAKLPKLAYLNIYNNTISEEDVKLVAGLTNLKTLNIRLDPKISKVTSMETFKNMKKLETLEIYVSDYYESNNNSNLIDLKGIENLKELNNINISGNFKNANLLKQLPKLKKLSTTEKLYNENGNKLTDKELTDLLKSLNLEKINLSIRDSLDINLGNLVQNSEKKVDIREIDNAIIKEVFKQNGGMFYDENTRISYYIENQNLSEPMITINTKNLGNRTIYVNINNSKFSTSMNIRWNTYIPGDTKKEINILDAKLKELLLKEYDLDGNKKITEQDMINITWLEGYALGISNLEGLQYAKNLQSAYLAGNYIKDLSPIINLENLTEINLSNNLISDISALQKSKSKELVYVGVNNNFITFQKGNANYNVLSNILKKGYSEEDLWQLELEYAINSQYDNLKDIENEVNLEANLKKRLIRLGVDEDQNGKITIKELYYAFKTINNEYEENFNLSNAEITDISGLEYLALGYIDLSDNNISDITPLTKNKIVRSIKLSNNNISNIKGIENCYALYSINLSDNKITDISPITNLSTMKKDTNWRNMDVDLSNNQISNIDCVKNWKNLNYLNLSGNKITNIKELVNYNFKLNPNATPEEIKESAQYLSIDLSENNIDMTKADNKKAKAKFDEMGSTLKLFDKTKTTEYILNKNGVYSKDSNLGILDTELSCEGQYEFVSAKDRSKYYPNGSDAKLAGIFMHTKYYDKSHNDEVKAQGYGVDAIVTLALKTEKALEGIERLMFTMKLPAEYVGGEAKIQSGEGTITKRTRNTVGLDLVITPDASDKHYGTITVVIRLKAKEYEVEDAKNDDEILNAINNEQNVTLDMKQEVNEISNKVFENLAKKEDLNLKVQTTNATWKFNSENINKPSINVNPTVTISNNKFENMDKPPFEDAIYLKFDHEGDLPGKAEIELDVSNNNIYEKGKTVYLYYFDSTKNRYQYIDTMAAGDKKITITLEHCSEYVISDKMIYTIGDVDNDGRVTATDAVLVLKHVAHNITLVDNEYSAADTDKDGVVDAKDAVLILKYVAHNITEF